jgi:hypothetical protein
MAYSDHDSSVFKNEFYSAAITIGSEATGPVTNFVYGSDAIVKLKNFNIFEALVDD